MRIKSLVIIGLIGVFGVAASLWILRSGPGSSAAVAEEGALAYPRGPHNGRLLSSDDLQVEVTIYETGVPPQFRVYAFDKDNKSVSPGEVTLQIELHRLGGRVDRIAFQPEADYLRGDAVVEEPHSFDVKVKATRAGRTHEWSYSQIEGKVRLGADQIKSAGIVIATVGPREMLTTLELPGEVKSDDTRVAHVVPTLQGVVTEVTKKAGDTVAKGELMAVLSSRELAGAKSAYLAAAHHVEFLRVALEREEALWKKKISAEREYLEAKRLLDEAQLEEQLAGQRLVAIGVPSGALRSLATAPPESLPRFEIRAPLGGTVVARDVTVGETVTAEERLFTVADLSTVWVDVMVYATDLGAVRQGQEATVISTDLGREITGRISFIGPLVGQETRAATARIVLPNPGGLWRPGLFVNVRLTRESVVIPIAVALEGIQTFRDWQVVFVKYGDWFEARPLKLGRRDGQFVEVLEGLVAGDQYASVNSFAIKAEIGKLGATHDH
jgi:membrane fusion protein, heavy metal efflux system